MLSFMKVRFLFWKFILYPLCNSKWTFSLRVRLFFSAQHSIELNTEVKQRVITKARVSLMVLITSSTLSNAKQLPRGFKYITHAASVQQNIFRVKYRAQLLISISKSNYKFLIHKSKSMTEELNQEQQMIVNSDYKLWKKEAPHQYDFCLLHSLQWPSYSFEWLPQQQVNQNYQDNFAIISANAADNQQSQLLKIKCTLPLQGKCKFSIISDQKYGQSTANKDKIQVIQKINLPNPINRARVCHANSSIVATSSSNGDVNLFTFKDGLIGKLVGHTSQGYGLSWNNHNASVLATGQADKRICLWDVEKNKVSNQKIAPFMEILHHNAPVEDVAWHKHHQNIFASCSDDRMVMLWDMRFRSAQGTNDRKPLFQIVAHTNQVYSLDFSPFNQFIFLSGSGDETASVWDMRNLTRSVETHRAHSNRVIKVQWNPFISTIFASCSNDRTICIWDLSKQKKQADSCLLFQHRGHRSKVVDFDWSPHQKLFIGSTEQSNSVHIWEMAQSIYYDDQDSTK